MLWFTRRQTELPHHPQTSVCAHIQRFLLQCIQTWFTRTPLNTHIVVANVPLWPFATMVGRGKWTRGWFSMGQSSFLFSHLCLAGRIVCVCKKWIGKSKNSAQALTWVSAWNMAISYSRIYIKNKKGIWATWQSVSVQGWMLEFEAKLAQWYFQWPLRLGWKTGCKWASYYQILDVIRNKRGHRPYRTQMQLVNVTESPILTKHHSEGLDPVSKIGRNKRTRVRESKAPSN